MMRGEPDVWGDRVADYKNNHYVPELILKGFQSDDNKFYYYNKSNPSKSIMHRNVSSVFSGRRIFWRIDDSGAIDKTLESDFYKRLDDTAATLIERMLSSVRKGRVPKLTKQEKSKWDNFTFLQTKRLPAFHNVKMDQSALESAVQFVVDRTESEHGPLGSAEIAYLRNYVETEENVQNAKIYALQAPGEQTQELLGSRGIGFARIAQPRRSFIIGDWPFVRPRPPLLSDPSGSIAEMWLPIAKDVAVSHSGRAGEERIIDVSASQVRIMNEAIYRQSSEVGSCSAELLASLGNLAMPAIR